MKVKFDAKKLRSKALWASLASLAGIILIQTKTIQVDDSAYQGAITAILSALTALGILVDGPLGSGE